MKYKTQAMEHGGYTIAIRVGKIIVVVKISMNRLFLQAIEILQAVLRQNGIRKQKKSWMILIAMTNIQRMYLMK